jgi:SPP1 gp7 family putative phage head morphogenesis protein
MPALRSEAYWEARAAARMDMLQADAEATLRKLNQAYRSATASMSMQINAMVRTFARRYGLTTKEAAKILSEPASRETLEALAEAVELMPDGAEKRRAMAMLNAPAARYRITNTQAIRTQAQAVCSRIADEEYRLFTDSLTKSIGEAYMRTAYDLQIGLGLAWKTTGISNRVMRQLLNEDWSGASYRTRIMGRYKDLANDLSTLMLEGMLGGRSRAQMIEEMEQRFAMDARDARRLLVTETTYVVNAAELERYKEDGVKEYVYIAVLDMKTSDICQTLDGMVINVKYAKAGKNFPPMHPNCRSTTGPVVDRRALDRMIRKATNPLTGEVMTLPPRTTYRDWYKMVIDGKAA